jgi:selenocysteine lyase/cysteine desulfurase
MLTRRACIAGAAAATLAAPLATALARQGRESGRGEFDADSPLPHKAAFAPLDGTYLNCASQHPLSLSGRAAINRYLDFKTFAGDSGYSVNGVYQRNLDNYARLINAHKDEVCFVQSTTVGENLVLKALGFPHRGGRIVTDELHYVGSLPTYSELARQGVEVATLRTDDGTLDLEQFERAITKETRLVAISSVSMVNGFQHDLAGLCDIAHANGALVYADVVHQVGSTPLDVRESGVDFCSSASYKWLLGEQGLGFLYARSDRLQEIERPWLGHYQLQSRHGLAFPNPERSQQLTDYEHFESALGYFAMGSQSNIVSALLDDSLPYLLRVGPARIQTYRRPLLERLHDEMPKLGFESITPRDTDTALVSFRHAGNTDELRAKLAAANVTISVAAHHLRVSPSVFNDMDDIERLVSALS